MKIKSNQKLTNADENITSFVEVINVSGPIQHKIQLVIFRFITVKVTTRRT